MERLFNRSASFILGDALYEGTRVIDGRVVRGIRFEFSVTRTAKAEPDKLELKVSNLSPDTRARLTEGMRVVLNAGYADAVVAVFIGTLRRWETSREGLVTSLVCGDGDSAYTEASASVSLAKGADLGQVVGAMAEAMGVDGTKAVARVRQGDIPTQARTYPRGFSTNAKASASLTRALNRAGLAWTIQSGELVALAPRDVLPGQAVLLSYDTGLIGSPNPGDKKESKGPATTSIRSLLQGAIVPGTALEVRSDFVRGLFRTQSVKHSGDTDGGHWYSDMETLAL